MTRIAGLMAAAVLLLPASAGADHPSAGEPAIGADHLRQHAKVWKAQAKARARWQRMSRAERRRAVRKERRATRRAYARARAAADGAPSDVGSWAAPFTMTQNYEGYAIHAAMLRTGKVLMWGYPINVEQAAFRGNESYAWLWDPSKGYGTQAVEEVTPTDANGDNVSIYCSGMSFLPDGRVLVVGGTLSWGNDDPNDEFTEFAGLNKAMIFDPADESWTDLPRPAGSDGRWYPTQTLLPDGRTFVISGLSSAAPGGDLNDGHEIYNAETNTFSLLTTNSQRRSTELYPHLFTMPDGKLLMAGPNPDDSARFDPGNLSNPWTNLPPLASQRIGGNAVLLPEGPAGSTQVAAIGGRPYGAVPPADNEVIDLDDASPSWTSFPGLNSPRSYPNTVQLPDGSMVTVGGDDRVANWPLPERAVELYDPVTGSWRVGPSQVETRAYHSTALLLPDGRVLSTGDDYNPTSDGARTGSSPNETGEIYSPPYLFKGARPAISSAPGAVRWGVPFGVGSSDDVDEAVLVAPAAVTHANDMNQRLVPLELVAKHPGGGLTVKSPPSANVAPPGYYMLFLLEDGVPSVAEWVRLDGSAADVPIDPPGPPDATSPETSVTAGPTGTTASNSASLEFSSSETGSTFQCKLDAGSWSACTSPKDYTGLADGSHTFSVKATDSALNEDQTPATRTWTVDTAGPDTTITSGPSGTVNATSVSFAFSSSEAGSTFECKLDSGAWAGCSSPKAYTSLAGGSHTFLVRAKDGTGTADPSPASRTWTVDTTAPDSSVTSGPSGTVNSASASFGFSATETGSTFECRLDGGAWSACTSPQPYNGLSDGSHTFSVRATDAAGNQDASAATRTWTVDTTAPETSIAAGGPTGMVAVASASFAFTSDDWAATFECRLDAGAWSACTSARAYSGLADGPHTFQVRATDAVGNTDATPAAHAWSVDMTPPETTITAAPSGTVASGSASFEFSSADAGAIFECRLDGGAWSACASPKAYSSLPDAPHTFEVRARDAGGNVDPSPASRGWVVDMITPAGAIVSGPTGAIASSVATFEFVSADEAASFECTLDSDDWQPCASPRAYSGLADGSHTFRVRAKDGAGNVHGEPPSRTWTIDTVAPDTSIASGPSGTVASGSASFDFSSADAGATFECRLDLGAWAACPSPATYGALADGTHTFSVRAVDGVGNVDATPASRTWTTDTTPPDTAISAGPVGTVASDSAASEFSSSDPAGSLECRLDSGDWAPCATPAVYSGLAEGGHTFSVRARDPAGNADPTPSEWSWSVDTTPDAGPEPGPTEPGPTEPGPTEPGPTEPGPTEPGPTEPGPTEPGPTEPGAEEPDLAGPVLRLVFAERRWLGRLRRTGVLRVRVTVDEPATVSFRLLRGRSRVARATVAMRRAGTRTIELKPRRSALAWLRKARTPKLRFSVTAIDAARNDTAWSRLLKPALRR